MKKPLNSYIKYVYIIFLNYAINIISVFSLSIDLNYINPYSTNNKNKIFKHINNDDDLTYDSMEYLSNTYFLNRSNKMLNTNSSNEINSNSFINQYQICTESLGKCIILSIMMGLLIICTIIGNSFVIAAVILERNLHNVANYLIVSLASADLTVAIMVMPIGAYQEVSKVWLLGKILCDIWTSFDVLCCTASILHLVAIALDRYWAISNVDYAAKRTSKRIFTMIIIIWSISTITGVSPHVFGLSFNDDQSGKCHLTDNLTYQLLSTLAAFYLPLIVMCIIYWKIFQSAKFRIRKKGFNGPRVKSAKKSKMTNKNNISDTKESNNLLTNNYAKTVVNNGLNNIKKESIPNDLSIESIKLNRCKLEKDISNMSAGMHKPATTTSTTIKSTSFTNNLKQNENSSNNVNNNANNKLDENKPQTRNKNNNASAIKSNLYLNLTDKYTTSQVEHDVNQTKERRNQIILSRKYISADTHDLDLNMTENKENNLNNDKASLKSLNNDNKNNNIVKKNDSTDTLSLELDDTLCMYDDTRIVERLDLKSGIPFAFSEYEIKSSLSSSYESLKSKKDLKVANGKNEKADEHKEISTTKEILNDANKKTLVENENKLKELNVKENVENSSKDLNKSTNKLLQKGPITPAVSCTQLNRPNINNILKNRAKIDIKRERKAAKTLGVIMSCFIICWLPFFLMQIFFSICKDCYVTRVLENSPLVTILTWCGYLNSLLNPVIYTIFSPDFRNAFAKILFGKYTIRNRNYFK